MAGTEGNEAEGKSSIYPKLHDDVVAPLEEDGHDFKISTNVGINMVSSWAAYGGFAKLFKPDAISMDEAFHAREPMALIPIAFFEPIVWIFTGDVKQTQPFVKSGDPYCYLEVLFAVEICG
ncbi:hypothetical protein H9Q72_000274 [Fusarium xylarioides]|uniref:DNA2/NAM7 helicase helicase domain-containing protein n=1 Tax=Fusarium xylarioides TaxID=221167 RepID=A0A9P7I5X3_9HYPO|nr:hypothetical protein H9Q70_013172 [Fusarium xylarioides]KAG5774206.1 hypothetical protein H9Q72_000274 [Fusarium xylarioides]KAG5783949.1 hypothetical protein H9Q73_002383 [Fusarium xylarioides]KAG5816556.1 hypothetical protein H9Q71_002321 [Fusarium xylarioides]KAG5829096.1 hypothetical protein H9Q74_000847 [Fusarium xylarioides]